LQIKTKIVSCHTADSKPVKQEVKGTVILPNLVFPGPTHVSPRLAENIRPGWNGLAYCGAWWYKKVL